MFLVFAKRGDLVDGDWWTTGMWIIFYKMHSFLGTIFFEFYNLWGSWIPCMQIALWKAPNSAPWNTPVFRCDEDKKVPIKGVMKNFPLT